jgi:FlaA1/EpsC-like NDP-sugar epimerase
VRSIRKRHRVSRIDRAIVRRAGAEGSGDDRNTAGDDTVFEAIAKGKPGQTFVPKVPAANIVDLAKAIMGDKDLPIKFTGIRPGEKVHEIMVSEEECYRTIEQGDYYVILPVLPELRDESEFVQAMTTEYSSRDKNISIDELRELLASASDEIKFFLAAGK